MMRNRLDFKRLFACLMLCCTLPMMSVDRLAAQAQAAPTPAPAPVRSTSTLTIRITGFRNAHGRINIALFRDAKGFPSEPASAVASQRLEINPQTMSATAVFKDLPQGVYAVSVFHDENLTGKMEFDAQGIPLNGYGFSNNPDSSYGPPTPDQAKFTVSQAETTIEIKLIYWQ
jgi:uncharacterized protein (DUF2141 family)